MTAGGPPLFCYSVALCLRINNENLCRHALSIADAEKRMNAMQLCVCCSESKTPPRGTPRELQEDATGHREAEVMEGAHRHLLSSLVAKPSSAVPDSFQGHSQPSSDGWFQRILRAV